MTRPLVRLAEPNDFSQQALDVLAPFVDVQAEVVAPTDLRAALASCDVFWLRLGHKIRADDLSGDRLKVIACPATGLDHIDVDACRARGIRVVALKGEVGFLRRIRATAEHTFALALALLRKLPSATAHTEQGGWDRDLFRGRELFESTMGIVGAGRLGTIVADMARAFGMRVVAYDPRDDFPDGLERVDSLQALCAQSDVVSLHVVYNDDTHHLIDAEVLAAMKPSAVLVNTSRGGVVDTEALLSALQSNVLAGAALDVVDGEPDFTADTPLLAYARDNDRLLVTPHIGGNTSESFVRTEVFLAHRVLQALGLEAVDEEAS